MSRSRTGLRSSTVPQTAPPDRRRHPLLTIARRQITELLFPGDLCEPFGILPCLADHTLGTITAVTLALIPPDDMRAAARSNPRVEEALRWDLLANTAMLRERVVSYGQRSAFERFAHLLCELHVRLAMVGLSDATGFVLPLTQQDLAQLLGLSTVHLNRTLQDLRNSGLVTLHGKRLSIHDHEALRAAALFDSAYLHLPGDPGGRG